MNSIQRWVLFPYVITPFCEMVVTSIIWLATQLWTLNPLQVISNTIKASESKVKVQRLVVSRMTFATTMQALYIQWCHHYEILTRQWLSQTDSTCHWSKLSLWNGSRSKKWVHHCHSKTVQHHTPRGIQLNTPGKQCYGLVGTHLYNSQIYNSTVTSHWTLFTC